MTEAPGGIIDDNENGELGILVVEVVDPCRDVIRSGSRDRAVEADATVGNDEYPILREGVLEVCWIGISIAGSGGNRFYRLDFSLEFGRFQQPLDLTGLEFAGKLVGLGFGEGGGTSELFLLHLELPTRLDGPLLPLQILKGKFFGEEPLLGFHLLEFGVEFRGSAFGTS